jgi:hypothetical protein
MCKKSEHRQKFQDYKASVSCKHCGIKDHRVMEFHHIGDKKNSVSKLVQWGYSWEAIEKEIKKCIPLCCNCHRLEHWED